LSRVTQFLLAGMLAAAPAMAQDDTDMQIEARRLGAMVEQSRAALHIIAPTWPVAQSVEEADIDAYGELVRATRRFDTMLAQACREKLADPKFCGPPYAPAWLKAKPRDLRAAIEDATGRITPFWANVCGRAKAKSGDTNLCAIE
jgi:hypothetical protein